MGFLNEMMEMQESNELNERNMHSAPPSNADHVEAAKVQVSQAATRNWPI